MKILAIGAGGFLGSFIARELIERGHEVVVADFVVPVRNPVEGARYVRGDVSQWNSVEDLVQTTDPEVVINLAGLLTGHCAKEPFRAVSVNICGIANVLEAARLHGVRRVINASSAGVCGPERKDTREEAGISPDISMYGATKFLGEVLAREYRRNWGLDAVNLRYSLIYGPGTVATPGNAQRLKNIERAVIGEDVNIPDARETDRAHLLHVTDAAHATVLAAIAPQPLRAVYNIAGVAEDFLSLGEVVGILRSINPACGKVTFSGQGTPVEHGLYLSDKARNDFDYIPAKTARQGFKENAQLLMQGA